VLLCSQCGKSLPDGSQFCLSCGPSGTANSAALVPVQRSGLRRAQLLPARRQIRLVPWLLVLVLLGALFWAATSENPAVQQVQEFIHWSHAETIVDGTLPVNPRSFSSSKFTVPAGTQSVTITGEFSVAAGGGREAGKSKASGHDTDIEAYVLTDAAFAVWSSGYSTQTQYESGSVATATIDAPLPAGGGVYHLVFSNKNSPRAKTVHANVLLRYKNWFPATLVRMKDQFWSWIGLA